MHTTVQASLFLALPLGSSALQFLAARPCAHCAGTTAAWRTPAASRQFAPGIHIVMNGVSEEEDIGTTYYEDKLCGTVEEECELPGSDEFTVAILGDLHLDPRKMEDYYVGREHFLPILEDARSRGVGTALVSLGDLGESKSVRPAETQELFAGTTACHELAADFLSSFGVDYEVIGGNHDLEGIDEFATDEANLEAMLRIHKKDKMQFVREVADKTLLVGLGSTVFRTAKYTSHEVRGRGGG